MVSNGGKVLCIHGISYNNRNHHEPFPQRLQRSGPTGPCRLASGPRAAGSLLLFQPGCTLADAEKAHKGVIKGRDVFLQYFHTLITI